jgi:hypothetical protein
MEPLQPGAYPFIDYSKGGTNMPLPVPRHQIRATVLHCYNPAKHEDKVYAVWIERRGDDYAVSAANGARARTGMHTVQPKGSSPNLILAQAAANAIVNAKRKGGYLDVESTDYSRHMSHRTQHWVTFEDVINPTKVDVTRIIGYLPGSESYGSGTDAATVPTTSTRHVAVAKSTQQTGQVTTGRSKRLVDL